MAHSVSTAADSASPRLAHLHTLLPVDRVEVEQTIASLARRQHGLVARAQLLAAGLSKHHVQSRLRTGHLVAVHRGVYQIGPLAAGRAPEMAAILACGKGSVLSHLTAARIFGLTSGASSSSPLHVGRPKGYLRRPGLVIHRLSTLTARDVTTGDGIPTTTVARTLWDLAGGSAPRELERLYAVALDRGLVRRVELERLVDRHPGAPGAGRIRALLDADPALTRSEAEERLLELVRAAGLPEPRTNARVQGLEVDCYWPHHGSSWRSTASPSTDRRPPSSETGSVIGAWSLPGGR